MASDVNTKPPQVYQKAFLLHHSGLVKNLTPQEVLDVAFAKGLISLEEKTRVAAERTDFDRVDQLLIVFHRRYASDTTVFKRLYEVVQQVNEEESGALSHVVNDLKATIDGNMVGDVTIPQGPLSDEDASSIAASEEVLKKSFEVKQVLPELISAGVITWEEHEKINEPVDFEERVAKFLQFLRQRGSAAFSRFVEVLDETEIYKKLADDLRKDHTPQPKSSTKMETDEAKGPTKPVKVKELRYTIKGKLVERWATLSESVEDKMDDFSKQLFEKGVIPKEVRKSKDYNKVMDTFLSAMPLFETVKEFQDHCLKLVDVLIRLGGDATRNGIALKDSWNTAVKDKFGINFLT